MCAEKQQQTQEKMVTMYQQTRLFNLTNFSVKSLKWKKSVLAWCKNIREVFAADIFIYESSEVWRQSKKCKMNLFIEQRTAKHHNKHKTLKIQAASVGRRENVLRGELPLRTTNAKTTLTKKERRKIWANRRNNNYLCK